MYFLLRSPIFEIIQHSWLWSVARDIQHDLKQQGAASWFLVIRPAASLCCGFLVI